jgi:hypothetical protein
LRTLRERRIVVLRIAESGISGAGAKTAGKQKNVRALFPAVEPQAKNIGNLWTIPAS